MGTDSTNKSAVPARVSRRRPRGRGIRVRTGCTACRQRHLKCDETHPICRACQKASRECIYPQAQHRQETPRQQTVDKTPADAAITSPLQEVNTNIQEADASSIEDTTSKDVGLRIRAPVSQAAGTQADDVARDTRVESRSLVEDVLEDRLRQDDSTTLYSGENTTYLPNDVFGFTDGSGGFEFPDVYDAELFGISPEASFGGWPRVTAEAASAWWFNLLASDINDSHSLISGADVSQGRHEPLPSTFERGLIAPSDTPANTTSFADYSTRTSNEVADFSDKEIQLLHHYVLHLSGWIDATDPDRHFAVIVPDLALKNRGLARAILALSSLHLSLDSGPRCCHSSLQVDPTIAVQYYNETLHSLQHEMGEPSFLRSDELLATVLIISMFEMIETKTIGSAWDKHLQGVFWIQRSQGIHGESQGLKKRIWWAWLRQDIWAAFRRRRQILSFYKLTRDCATLGFWELVDRAIYLLGQCVNYASTKEEENGRSDIQRRLDDSAKLWQKLEEFSVCFAKHDRRLPVRAPSEIGFAPIWINPAAASIAIQVHHFSKLLLLEYTPAIGGMKELTSRQTGLQAAVEVICGIASCTEEAGAVIISTQCVFAAGHHVQNPAKREQVLQLLNAHRETTGWPHYDLTTELESFCVLEDMNFAYPKPDVFNSEQHLMVQTRTSMLSHWSTDIVITSAYTSRDRAGPTNMLHYLVPQPTASNTLLYISDESTESSDEQLPWYTSMTEVFSALGFPARVLGRLPLTFRYALNPHSEPSSYGLNRYGPSYRFRLWLRLDIVELESIEMLINYGSDTNIEAFRASHLAIAGTTSVVGGLLVSASSAILALESLADMHYAARGLFILSLLLSLLSVYFTLLQQRELVIMDTKTLRVWLWDGTTAPASSSNGRQLWRSSLSSNIMLQAPFELLAIAIALFLGALGSYLGLAYASRVDLSKGWDSNLACMVAFVTTAVFSLALFGQTLGQKDKELTKCKTLLNEGLVLGPQMLHDTIGEEQNDRTKIENPMSPYDGSTWQ